MILYILTNQRCQQPIYSLGFCIFPKENGCEDALGTCAGMANKTKNHRPNITKKSLKNDVYVRDRRPWALSSHTYWSTSHTACSNSWSILKMASPFCLATVQLNHPLCQCTLTWFGHQSLRIAVRQYMDYVNFALYRTRLVNVKPMVQVVPPPCAAAANERLGNDLGDNKSHSFTTKSTPSWLCVQTHIALGDNVIRDKQHVSDQEKHFSFKSSLLILSYIFNS